jgi:hypothetical protein
VNDRGDGSHGHLRPKEPSPRSPPNAIIVVKRKIFAGFCEFFVEFYYSRTAKKEIMRSEWTKHF